MKSDLPSLKKLYLRAKDYYYNQDVSIMNDEEFDSLENRIRKLDPTWKELAKTGVPILNKKKEVPLVRFAPSLNKMYEEGTEKFYKSVKAPIRQWIWMDKLDGTSLQGVYRAGKISQLITRGDGETGGDVSFLIPYLVEYKRLPATITKMNEIVIRFEGIMQKKVFAANWSKEALGEKKGADNARNFVNGLFNRMTPSPALQDVDLVVLGVYGFPLVEGLSLARKWKFKVVPYVVTSEKIGHAKCLRERKVLSQYEMDGLVIAPSGFTMAYENADKPKGIIAFKFNDEENAAQCKVKRIIYQTSGFGRIVPKLEIEPTRMDGVTVKHCTVHNAKWMLDRGIGPGAIVKIVRSGGVIPKVVGVVKKAKPQLPTVPHKLKGVHFVALDDSAEQDVRIIDRFLSTLGVEFVARKTIAHLYRFGLCTPEDYIRLALNSLIVEIDECELRGLAILIAADLGPVQSKKIFKELQRVFCNPINLKTLMVASPCFDVGVGERRLSMIEAAVISMNDLLNWEVEERDPSLFETLIAIKGFSKITAELIIEGLYKFEEWFQDVKALLTVNGSLPKVKTANKKGKLSGMKITWTGYRNPQEEALVEKHGGEVAKFSAKTDVLLYKTGGKASSKVEKVGDKAMTWAQFSTRYGVR